jgi:hypothetical protein
VPGAHPWRGAAARGAEGPPLMIDDIDSPYAHNDELKATIFERGL